MRSLHLLQLGLLWWVLAEGDPTSWWVGVPVVLIAGHLARRLDSPGLEVLSAAGLLRFLPFFVGRSLSGGLDIARRAIDPRLPLDPAVVEHDLRLPEGMARQVFVGVVGLLPGTLVMEVEGDRALVHCVDGGDPVRRDLVELEEAVADLFGVAPRIGPSEERAR